MDMLNLVMPGLYEKGRPSGDSGVTSTVGRRETGSDNQQQCGQPQQVSPEGSEKMFPAARARERSRSNSSIDPENSISRCGIYPANSNSR